jgi:hypothetical protein
MKYPNYYNDVEQIRLKDELSNFLGSSEDGIIDISYLDVVKMAGHSCVLVSGTYLMALKGLQALYGKEPARRGEIKVELKAPLEEGNTGAAAQVLSNITGATLDSGFRGINGKFNRRGLLYFGADIKSNLRFTRLDTNKSVEVSYSPGKVVNPGAVMQSTLGPDAREESKKTFPKRWQEMIKTIFDHAEQVITVTYG